MRGEIPRKLETLNEEKNMTNNSVCGVCKHAYDMHDDGLCQACDGDRQIHEYEAGGICQKCNQPMDNHSFTTNPLPVCPQLEGEDDEYALA